MLPISTAHGGGLAPLPALFTATSALCVTGLANVDTATYWTPFGQAVILALIQIGGFGVMSFATILAIGVTRRSSLGGRVSTATEAHGTFSDLPRLLRRVLTTTVVLEAAIAVALTIRFWTLGYTPGGAAWRGVFHAISAFNNAGFSIEPGNLVRFVGDWGINVPIMVALILGGLGFPVIGELLAEYRWPHRWSLNTRMVLVATAGLLVASAVFVTALEWTNPRTLGPLPVHTKLLAGTFQAVQTRTAGFNTVDIGSLRETTQFGMDLLMFIGAGPAGTAGGIKVTTFLALIFIVWSELRHEDAVNIFGKRLSRSAHRQIITVTMLAAGLVMVSTLLLLLLTDFSLSQVLFEVTSAFGTVGLSTGITASLDPASQLVIIVCMISGRLGPITVATALAIAPVRPRVTELPKERPIIG